MTDGQIIQVVPPDPPESILILKNRFFWLSLVLIASMVALAWQLEPETAIYLGLAALTLLLVLMARAKHVGCQIVTAVVLLLMLTFCHSVIHHNSNSASAQSRQNLHAIQLSIERYASDHDCQYPLDYSDVMEQGYMPMTPPNPYWSWPRTPQEQSMGDEEWEEYRHMLPLGSSKAKLGSSKQSRYLGDFAYFPHVEVTEDGSLIAKGYAVCVFTAVEENRSASYKSLHTYWLESEESYPPRRQD